MAWNFPEYPDNWDEIRAGIFERDNYTCQRCGAEGRGKPKYGKAILQCAHKTHKSKGGTEDPGNLEAVCLRCHVKEHPHLFNSPITRKLYSREVAELGVVL